ncbi:tape measure protein [Microbacterium phage Zooman]|nr:tape measure protein [Microbacterium phage Zooman]
MVSLMSPVYIPFRAVTNSISSDISKGLSGARGSVRRDGENLGRAFSDGFNRGVDVNGFRRVANGIRSMVPEAEAARRSFSTLVRTSYTLGTGLTAVVGGVSSVVSALGALAGAAGGASSTVAVLGNGLFALGAGMVASRLALGGVGKALQQLNQQTARSASAGTQTALSAVRDSQAREAAARRIEDAERSLARLIETNRDRLLDANRAVAEAQLDLTNAVRAGREEIQQLGFDAEDAALSEQRASLNLEKAREALAKAQDLPPNSRARREAELAYAEAELNYRKAKDSNQDLQKEQDRLAKSGVNGLAGVIAARNKVAEAEANKAEVVKDALQAEEDALRDVAQARKDAQNVDDRQDAAGGVAAAAAAGKAWDDGLNDAQRKFVRFLNGLRPQMEALSEIAANAFLPDLQRGIEILMEKAYPVVAVGIGQVADAMGDAAIILAEFITTSDNLTKLSSLFASSAPLIKTFANIFGNLYDILLSIFVATAPMAQDFFDFINESLGKFSGYLNSFEGKNAMADFFEKASFTAKLFGDVFGNVMGGIGSIIQANIGDGTGGQILLDYFKTATEDWGKGGMNDFFINVANNATKVLDTLGSLVGILGRVGENQNLGKAFEVLLQGAPALENILQTTVDAAPQLADLVVTLTEIVSALSDTGSMQVFFETLNNILTPVLDFVKDPANKEFLDFWGRIFAMFSAVGLVAVVAGTGLKIIAGSILGVVSPMASIVGLGSRFKDALFGTSPSKLTKGMDVLSDGFKKTGMSKDDFIANLGLLDKKLEVSKGKPGLLTAPMAAMSGAFKGLGPVLTTAGTGIATFGKALLGIMLGPVGIVIGVIAGLVGLFVTLYNTNDQFKKDMDKVWADLSKVFMESGQQIMDALQPLIPIFSQIIEAIVPVITTIVQSLVPVITMIIEAVAPLITMIVTALVPVFELLANVLGFIVPILTTVLTVIVTVLAEILKVVIKVITAVIVWVIEAITNFGTNWDNFWAGIGTFFSDVWNGFLTVVSTVWEAILTAMDTAWQWINTYILQPIVIAVEAVGWAFGEFGRFVSEVWTNIQKAIDTVWKWIDRYIFLPIRQAMDIVGAAFRIAGAVMQKAWVDLQIGLNEVWKWIDNNIFNPIKTAVGLVQQAFENVAEGIAVAWDGIKKAAAVPINFVIDTVYNNGLRSFWNDIADNLNMKDLKLPKAKTVAFAGGGVMPGYSPGRDIHKFYSPTGGFLHLSGGEAIMRPEWTRMMGGPAAIARMNRAAISGRQAFATGGVYSAPRVQRFASGGTVDFAGDLLDNIGDFFGIIGDFFANPIDAVQKHLIDGLVKPLLNNGDDSLFGQLIGGVPIRIAEGIGGAFKDFFGGFNAAAGQGTSGMGYQAMTAMVKQAFPGLSITSGYRSPGANAAVGGAKGSYHMQGRAIDVVPATMDTFNKMLALFPNARELIYTPAGNRQLLNGKPFSGWSSTVKAQHYNHIHAAMAKGGTVFPSNGGTIVQVAEAGRAERIEPLDDNGISERDKAWAELFTQGMRGDVTINVYQLPGEDAEAFAQRVSRIISRDTRMGAEF